MPENWKKLKPPKSTPGPVTSHPQKVSSNTKHPSFSFEYFAKKEFNTYREEEKKAFFDKILELTDLTWQQMSDSGRHQTGYEIIRDFPLPRGVTEDANVIAFRYNGLKAMIGFRDGFVFYVMKLDPNFKAYKHGS